MEKVIVRREAPGGEQGVRLPDDLHPLLARLFRHRGLVSEHELARSLRDLHPVDKLKGVDEAVALLLQALEQDWRILIVGDFDADGATSCALAMRALRMMGAVGVDYLVPNRFEYGYGLTPEIVDLAAQSSPDLIITVDNGISSLDGVAAARARGMHVLVTDHHLPGEHLPEADAIVNPTQPGDGFPSKVLAGVGVIFYVMMALRTALRDSGWFAATHLPEPNLAALLDLVALGTVADVVPLDHNNRILVAQGLARIRRGLASPGINALIRVAGRHPASLVSVDLGFALGPRLNAAGRLDDMSLGIACLLADDEETALSLARRLDELNLERRNIEQGMQTQALAIMDELHLTGEEDSLPFGLCLYDPGWHQGVIGILASRIRERVHRPVIIFADSGDGEIKGSARSVPGLHIRDVLDAVAGRHPGLIPKFGGHSMAAGLSLKADQYEVFRRAFDAEVRRHLDEDDLCGIIHSDGELTDDELSLEVAELLRHASPWGRGFPEPVFDGHFKVLGRSVLKERHLKLRLRPGMRTGGERDEMSDRTEPDNNQSQDCAIDALMFNADDAVLERDFDEARLAYRLSVNEWRGRRSLQLIIEHLEPA